MAGNKLCIFDHEVLRLALMKNNKLKEIYFSCNDFAEEIYNKLIDDNPAKKILMQPCNNLQNSSFTDSSRDNVLLEDGEMEEDQDEYQYRTYDYYTEDPNFDDDYNSEREPYKDY